MEDAEVKVVVVGTTGVGKTSLSSRLVSGSFQPETSATIGASFVMKRETDTRTLLMIWDTAGEEQYRSLGSLYYRGAQAAVLVADLTSAQSLQDLLQWGRDVRSYAEDGVVLAVAVNKRDLEHARQVSEEQIKDVVSQLGAATWRYTSAVTGEGVEEVFQELSKAVADASTRRRSGTVRRDRVHRLRSGEQREAASSSGCC
mmetsp:Transcript_2196/g.6525  ORF Transcript_2196/g.6525 Transcript_2196/m.6525 type:complete len:201 (-) Transcript_2196:227-829(-)